MREFKFRAWNGETIIYPTLIKNELYPKVTDWVLMLYTGLKDKNDKEICEGDILKTKYNDKPFEAYWSDEYLAFYIRFANIHINKNGTTALSLFDRMEYEVIGNVFENPELINSK